jgi:hypothetical protein
MPAQTVKIVIFEDGIYNRENKMPTTKEQLLKLRDAKVAPHLDQYAPVWLVDEKMIEIDDAVQFNVIFQHHLYGWVNRRYRYDGFNDTLYHKGQVLISEDEVLKLQENEPYISANIADIPNSYGG